jgi:hypothetical protein
VAKVYKPCVLANIPIWKVEWNLGVGSWFKGLCIPPISVFGLLTSQVRLDSLGFYRVRGASYHCARTPRWGSSRSFGKGRVKT